MTLAPTAICRRAGAPSLGSLKFFRVTRCTFEWKPTHNPSQCQKMSTAPVYQPVSPIKASPTKRARVFYELPKGDVLGQARLRIYSQDEFSNSSNNAGSAWAGPVTPKPKAARLTAVSSPTKHCCWTQQKNYSREELCNAISSLYEYKEGEEEEEEECSAGVCADICSAQQAGIKSYKAQSPQKQKQSSPVFTAKGKRLTIPEFTPMRRFPQPQPKK